MRNSGNGGPMAVSEVERVRREPDICPRCKCCELISEECGNCEDGYSSHDCGEDCCCCEDPIDNVPCDMCCGRGYFLVCIGDCDAEGKHRAALAEAGKEQK